MKRLITAACVLGTLGGLAFAGAASANRYDADASCVGLTVDMPRTEDGTTVTVYRNGTAVRTVTNDVFGAPVRLFVPSPDQTVTQSWRVTVVGHNGSSEYAEVVEPCVVPTTTTVAPTTTTSTTIPVAPTTTTVVPEPRPTTTLPAPTTTVPFVGELPSTGIDTGTALLIVGALLASGYGLVVCSRIRRKEVRS